jgi:peptidoglycan/LPS O-acetylase OafA/YrhL
MNRNGGKMSWGVFYLHRAIRILPLYMVATYFYIFLFPYLGFGPAWYLYEHSTEVGCSDYWWSNFVLLNNFLPTSEYSCMSWSWYIACDMQFYLLSPLLLLLQYHKKLYGYLTCALLILANFICLIVQGSVNDYLPGASGGLMNEEQFTQIYIKPYDRMGAYIIGITLGFLIVDFERVKNKPKEQVEIELGSINYEDKTSEPLINHKKTWEYKAVAWVHVKKFRIIAMAGGIALILAMICLPYNYDQHGGDYWPKWFRVLFLASEHIGFTVGLAGFTLPMVFGYGGIFYDVLAHDFFALTSKICFAFYLVHPMWIVFSCMNTPQGIYFEDIFILFRFFGIVLLSVVSAVLLYLIVECPVAKLEKKMMAWIKNRIGT